MQRACRITDCTNTARTGRLICGMHRQRIWRHGTPDFTEWTVADEHDVALIIRDARPVHGLTRLERVLVARGLTERGTPAEEIARLVGVTPRTVYRWRSQEPRRLACDPETGSHPDRPTHPTDDTERHSA